MKVSASAAFEIFLRIVRVSELRQLSQCFGRRIRSSRRKEALLFLRRIRVSLLALVATKRIRKVSEEADMLQCAQLVVFLPAVIMHLVHLQIAEAQDEVRGATVAGTAFRAAWITPDLLPDPARSAPILDREFCFSPFGRYQCRVGLAVVPLIRIAGPLPGLHQHNPRFDSSM